MSLAPHHRRPCPPRATVLLLAAAFAVAAGCAEIRTFGGSVNQSVKAAVVGPDGVVVLQPLAPVRRDIYTRSYRLGETYTVRTGEPVVSIKNYSITEKVGRATALRDFGQMCKRRWLRGGQPSLCDSEPLDSVRGAMGSVFDVIAAATLPDGQYFAVAMPSNGRSQTFLLVDPTGRLRRDSYVVWREELSAGYSLGRVPIVELNPDVKMASDSPLFSFESVERFVFMGPGYLSFDLVFTGTRDTVRGELMTFSYREFGRDSTDRPAFERPLQFGVGNHVLEVEKLRIEVEPVGYNELRFRVIADGQPTPTSP